jgi:hypothetical protein
MIKGLKADYSATLYTVDEWGGIYYMNAGKREYVDIALIVTE